ncbi:MAG: restriction endonuclease [Chloroflexi bacterium]|nr:restriction endonuclease [Chloroflexota bacterium]
MVFERVFPKLVAALADAEGADLAEARQAALIFLYRLLFLLYAEDRGLLPVDDSRYDDYGLRKRVRDDIAGRMDQRDTFSATASHYGDHLTTLCRLIDRGDASIGLPPYNGGLFAPDAAPLLDRVRLPDAVVAPIVYDLSHAETREGRRFVNYRDMSVQQLGSIYERLLEREPLRGGDGAITIRPNPYARKDSGSFYTPQELVDLIVERTLKPLAEERLRAFEEKAAALRSDRRPKGQRLAELRALDPAAAVLDLKVLDPAMGSGHFLVTAVDFLSDYIAELVEYVPAVPEWLGGGKGGKDAADEAYASPLVERVAAIRAEIIQRARAADWVLDEAQLSDQAIIRRMVLKRCIYGVDKNPLTVELAKVALWLHSFTVGAPLSFLDHHLRCGDSLIGLRVLEAREELRRLGGLSASSAIAGAESAASGMQRIEELSDADVAEVRESADLFRGVEGTTADLRGLLDILCGLRWLSAGMKKRERAAFEAPLAEALDRQPAQAYTLLAQGRATADPAADSQAFGERWDAARSIADRERFLHWEAAFPGVWQGWQDDRPRGGFDAVIGNPPWDQIEQPEVEWFAARDDEIARAATGAKRKALIQQRIDEGDELAMQYEAMRNRATAMRVYMRASGDYPLLSGGRINLYSLFVERAMRLAKPDGLVGLLTPSGIYADKTAARFFQSLSTGGRIAGLFDFENRRLGTDLPPFFPDVDSRFKFCALVFGGEGRCFDQTECAFFLPDTAAIKDRERCFPLAPADFARVNPNTGTAPVFRTRRDAEITGRIYERHPVLVDRSGDREQKAWPVRYQQGLFNMTSDSHLFRTAAQLETEGCYPVQGNRWKRGEELFLPLYQGRMIHQFDHRANSVRVNPESTHNPYLSEEVGEAQHQDPGFLPQSQYWVPAQEVERTFPQRQGHILGFRLICKPTDARTTIASIVPWAGFGHSVALVMGDNTPATTCLVANLNATCLDFVARQKVQGENLSFYIAEQLPVIAPGDYDRPFGALSARDLVRDHVLRLTYTAHDMAPFARDLGYDGPPFPWDEEERRHLRARLDACYFHLYGLGREDADYVLGTFPIVRREDEARFGSYRTRDLVLAYMNALAAGDTETVVAV